MATTLRFDPEVGTLASIPVITGLAIVSYPTTTVTSTSQISTTTTTPPIGYDNHIYQFNFHDHHHIHEYYDDYLAVDGHLWKCGFTQRRCSGYYFLTGCIRVGAV